MKRTIILISLFLALTHVVSATAQYPDKLIYKGTTYMLHANPMEAFFAKHPEKRPKTGIVSSALWRGYVATFEFKNEQLVLKDIEVQESKRKNTDSYALVWKSALRDVVAEGDTLKIDWFTGLMSVPYGKRIRYVHMGYASTYENYILIEVEKGKFVKEKRFGHEEYVSFKKKQFEEFKKTAKYKELAADMRKRNPDSTDEFIDRFLSQFVISYSTKILVN